MANDAISNLGKWCWYLVPANPILVRVVHGGSRRIRHLWIRFGYLLVLFMVFLIAFMSSDMKGSLSEAAKTSTAIFRVVSITQLFLMCFLAPVFTAGAITQEKDAQTFNILLTTPLSSAQIILGTLLSRLFFVVLLLLSGLPIFCITMLYGGVTFEQIVLSFAIAGATAVITGSLAILISMVRIGTRRTIFSFVLAIGLYLLVVVALGYLNFTYVAEAPAVPGSVRQMSWLAAFHPFLSLEVGLGSVPAPALSEVAHYGWPTKYLYAYPHISYVVITMLASVVMVICSMLFVRRGVKEGEPTLMNKLAGGYSRGGSGLSGERRRKPSRVWSNPIAWREASTKASATSSGATRYLLIVGGMLVGLMILLYLAYGWTVTRPDGTMGGCTAADARRYLGWLVVVEFALILLVVTNASATSMTKERESNTMDILLCTPLTSQAIVWGKLRGLVSFAVPMLAVPILTLTIFAVYQLFAPRQGQPSVIHFEIVPQLAALMLVNTALASVVGLQTSLKSKTTVRAVLVSISVMTIVCMLLYVIGNSIVEEAPQIGGAIAPMTPFTAVKALINGWGTRDYDGYSFADQPGTRIMLLVGTCIAVCVYAAIVGGMYKSLVRNFDMTIRKQTAS